MQRTTGTSIALTLLATVCGCSQDGAAIGDDGIYLGELAAGNARRAGGEPYVEYAIDVAAGEELDVTLQSGDFDAYLLVEDEAGNVVGEDDDSAGGHNSNLIVVAPAAARYTIVASSFDAGDYGEYVLAVRRRQSEQIDGVFTGILAEIDPKSFATQTYPRHKISASAGEVLDIRLTSGAFDTLLQIEDGDGNVVAEDDDSAGGTNSHVTLPVRDDATFAIVVRSFDDEGSGAYTVTVERSATDGDFEYFRGKLTTASLVLEDGTPYAIHMIDAVAGEQLEIEMTSSAFDAFLQLWNDFDLNLAQDDDSGGGLNAKLSFVVPADGQYKIVANSVGGDAVGAYDITLRRRSLDTEIASGEVEILTGSLSASLGVLADGTPTSSHEIEARAGERLDISMTAADFDAYLLVFDSNDRKLGEDDDSGGGTNAHLSVIAPTNGTYRIVANSYSGDAEGPYTITLRRE